ncbi:MAG: 30S ribosomal protein S3 [Candidatus Woesearchaeota archaeon]|nr:30S ribosomal protein S3 [Candidatus Woesearchaeota archaeon]
MAIERKFIQQNLKEFQIKEHIFNSLGKVGVAHLKLQRTPLGEKILISCSRPGLVVGRGGANIQKITKELKDDFGLENPQIEIEEVTTPMLEPAILAEMISNSLERFGAGRFKGIGHKALGEAMRAGALGVEILISGKIPSQRAKTWRFYQGYMKKCGDVAVEGVDIAYRIAKLKLGVVGIKVSVVPPTTVLPDRIDIHEPTVEEVTNTDEAEGLKKKVEKAEKEEKKEEKPAEDSEKTEEKPKKKAAKKKKAVKKEEAEEKPKKKAAKKTTKKEEAEEKK